MRFPEISLREGGGFTGRAFTFEIQHRFTKSTIPGIDQLDMDCRHLSHLEQSAYLPGPRRESFGERFCKRNQKYFAHAMEADSWSWFKHIRTSENTGNLPPAEIPSQIDDFCETGVDLTAISLHFFVLACILHPDAVERAREELDDVVARSPLSNLHHLPEMPYFRGFVKEVILWRPIL